MLRKVLALHATCIALHFACAAYAFSSPLLETSRIPATLGIVDYATNSSALYYIPSGKVDIDMPSVIFLHGVVAIVTLLFHAVLYVPAHIWLRRRIWRQGFFGLRWIEYSVTCTIMSISSIMSAGNDSFTSVLSSILLGICLQTIGCVIEQRKEFVYVLFFIGSVLNLANSASSVWYLASAPSLDTSQALEFFAYAFFYSLFPLNSFLDATRRENAFVVTDWYYNVFSVSSKVALFWLQVSEVERRGGSTWWVEFQAFGLGIGVPAILLAAGWWFAPTDAEIASSTEGSGDKGPRFFARMVSFRIAPTREPIAPVTQIRVVRVPRLSRNL